MTTATLFAPLPVDQTFRDTIRNQAGRRAELLLEACANNPEGRLPFNEGLLAKIARTSVVNVRRTITKLGRQALVEGGWFGFPWLQRWVWRRAAWSARSGVGGITVHLYADLRACPFHATEGSTDVMLAACDAAHAKHVAAVGRAVARYGKAKRLRDEVVLRWDAPKAVPRYYRRGPIERRLEGAAIHTGTRYLLAWVTADGYGRLRAIEAAGAEVDFGDLLLALADAHRRYWRSIVEPAGGLLPTEDGDRPRSKRRRQPPDPDSLPPAGPIAGRLPLAAAPVARVERPAGPSKLDALLDGVIGRMYPRRGHDPP